MTRPLPGSTFPGHWLRLREAADTRARDKRLTRRASDWLEAHGNESRAYSLVDLGSGNGSNPQYLADQLPSPQRWQLIDHDPVLLAQASGRFHELQDSDGTQVQLITQCHDLSRFNPRLLDGSDLVCASALFDLVSEQWITRLVDACAMRRVAVLFTLTFDGKWTFIDHENRPFMDEEDYFIHALINMHQQRDKGFGPALGGKAPRVLENALVHQGYTVTSAPSPWLLGASDVNTEALALALLDDWARAAHEQSPQQASRIATWRARRSATLLRGDVGVRVGHVDIFAHPGEEH